jgi:putative transposase
MPYEYKQFYRRKLPHMHAPGSTLFVTFRLADSVPQKIIAEWKAERNLLEQEIERSASIAVEQELSPQQKIRLASFHRRWFKRFEDILHAEASGPVWLKVPEIADQVAESLHYRDGKVYRLEAFTVMSNHVHVVFKPLLDERSLHEISGSNPLQYQSDVATLGAIMHSLKRYTARKANIFLGRVGQFWEVESYDHQVRDDEEFDRIMAYVLNNPVKAGLVRGWQDWKWNWRRERGRVV